MKTPWFFFLSGMILFSSCVGKFDDDDMANANEGAVYAMTNGALDNKVVAYGRAGNGTLSLIGSYSTGGQGVGNISFSGPGADAIDPLGSNYALIMDEDNSLVFAVNAGSNDVSSFSVDADDYSLTLVGTVPSGGTRPISLAAVGNTLFVLNENGGNGQINAFDFDEYGNLQAVANSARSLEGRPLSIRASEDESHLITTILPDGIVVHSITGNRLSNNPTDTVHVPMVEGGMAPAVPFGIETLAIAGTQYVFTSDARGGVSETSTVSSYTLHPDGNLTSNGLVALGDNPTSGGEVAACWIVSDTSTATMYTSNTGSSTISSLGITADGTLDVNQLRAFDDPAEPADSGLTDLVIADEYLYQLYSAVGEVHVFAKNSNGTLTFIESKSDLEAMGGNQGITGF